MGTPDFAVASLDALVTAGHEIVGVITAPDKLAGRGMKLTESAVKKYAVEKNLPVLQPEKLKDPAFIESLKALNADVQIVVAFRMLPEIVWNMPPMGTINVHGSLLPDYRGAAPINWAVMNGEKETGVTTFKLKHEIDTGNILLQDRMPIGDNETATEVHDRMKILGAQLLLKTVTMLAAGTLKEYPQQLSEHPKHAPKLFTKDCEIDWNNPVHKIHNQIRGLSVFPGALTKLEGKILKVFTSMPEIIQHKEPVGNMLSDGKTYLKFACNDGYLHIKDLQLEGKKRMTTEDFLRGYRLSNSK
ncbi:MAG: methionyl-tRNA formyltransferase [Chitinophagaceae bacterium]|nr:MAG: methionyl-tRNA [Chitinophagaceae bacterium]TXT33742.1 MAG: methionyl-tRNA formyltransferase [Chitinophagaceae bacterium]